MTESEPTRLRYMKLSQKEVKELEILVTSNRSKENIGLEMGLRDLLGSGRSEFWIGFPLDED